MSTQLHFFNTNDSSPEQVKVQTEKNITQEIKCYQILIEVGTHLNPFEVWRVYNKKYGKVPIGSIRRALTCGVRSGLLEKVNITKKGDYGVNNYQWQAIPQKKN